jgi:hypothetical protein
VAISWRIPLIPALSRFKWQLAAFTGRLLRTVDWNSSESDIHQSHGVVQVHLLSGSSSSSLYLVGNRSQTNMSQTSQTVILAVACVADSSLMVAAEWARILNEYLAPLFARLVEVHQPHNQVCIQFCPTTLSRAQSPSVSSRFYNIWCRLHSAKSTLMRKIFPISGSITTRT